MLSAKIFAGRIPGVAYQYNGLTIGAECHFALCALSSARTGFERHLVANGNDCGQHHPNPASALSRRVSWVLGAAVPIMPNTCIDGVYMDDTSKTPLSLAYIDKLGAKPIIVGEGVVG